METMQTANPPSFETVWTALMEDREQLKELRESQKETDRIMKETERIVARVSKQMGDLHNSFGEMAEHLVAPSIEERFNELGFHFNAVAPGGYRVLNDMKKIVAQVDILLLNNDYIMAVEVKAKVHTKDIEHHVKRLELLRKHWEKNDDKRVIQGAIAGAIFGNLEKKAAIEAGLYVLVQSGDTMKLELPEGFVPRDW
jgi:predicted AAA+ superfamily ATPase